MPTALRGHGGQRLHGRPKRWRSHSEVYLPNRLDFRRLQPSKKRTPDRPLSATFHPRVDDVREQRPAKAAVRIIAPQDQHATRLEPATQAQANAAGGNILKQRRQRVLFSCRGRLAHHGMLAPFPRRRSAISSGWDHEGCCGGFGGCHVFSRAVLGGLASGCNSQGNPNAEWLLKLLAGGKAPRWVARPSASYDRAIICSDSAPSVIGWDGADDPCSV